MHLDKLFGSKTKVDILKYLLFRRQGVSMRALETELERTFPAIKKQIDSLKKANIIEIGDDANKRSIILKDECTAPIRGIFLFGIEQQLKDSFNQNQSIIDRYYLGKFFGSALDMDLIVIYKDCEREEVEPIKIQISDIFREHFIENISVVFMSAQEWDQRYRLADKFVLNIMKHNITPKFSLH
jgi:hypothetical protein